jgi:pilus assembly protein FimV
VAQTEAESEPAATEAAAPPPAAQLGSQDDEQGGLFSSLWTWLVVIAVILAGFFYVRSRREEESEVPYESWASATAAGGAAETATAAAVASAPGIQVDEVEEASDDESAVATGSETEAETEPEVDVAPKPSPEPAESRPPAATGEYAYPFEDTIAGATGINLEQSDPLAEADFHMAYGLYDQAADLVGKAIERDPDRSDLRLKLLDILFVWGKQEEFLAEAKDLRTRLDGADSSEWERVAIMGRQICPDETIFGTEGGADAVESAGDSGPAGDDSDVDFAVGEEKSASESDSLDFDLSATGEVPGLDEAEAGGPEATAELEIEDLGLNIDLDELSGEHLAEPELQETSETEELERSAADETVEDTSATEMLDKANVDEQPEETGLTEVLNRVEEAADDETAVASAEDLDLMSLDSEGETKELPALDVVSGDEETVEVAPLSEEDLNLEDLTAETEADLDKTAEIPIAGQGPDGETLIEEIFGEEDETKIASSEEMLTEISDSDATQEMPQIKPSDVTLSEVGTKLDLARAYIDMGDPDGAKSILEEVIEEGDDAQKKEARQLIDGLE